MSARTTATKKKAATKKKTATKKKAATKKTAPKKAAAKAPAKDATAPKKPRVYRMSFASVYPLYIQKVERKGRKKAELDEVIAWLTGYVGKSLQRALDDRRDLETFFADAPRMNPNVGLITGVVCGVRVEAIEDPLMRNIRYLDKLVDELAKGRAMEKILRA